MKMSKALAIAYAVKRKQSKSKSSTNSPDTISHDNEPIEHAEEQSESVETAGPLLDSESMHQPKESVLESIMRKMRMRSMGKE
jgi:hypothetical protein